MSGIGAVTAALSDANALIERMEGSDVTTGAGSTGTWCREVLADAGTVAFETKLEGIRRLKSSSVIVAKQIRAALTL
jgi:hypothetical protein